MGKDDKSSGPTSLLNALTSRSATKTLAEIASEAGVSTTTLTAIRGDAIRENIKTALASRRTSKLIGSFARLSVYLGLDPEKVLKEYGLEITDAAKKIISKERIGEITQIPPDRTLSEITRRMKRGDKEHVIVGLIDWPPFYEPGITPGPGSSPMFASAYTAALLSSIQPDWKIGYKIIKNFHDALTLLTSDPPGLDVVFGLYDTPYRRLAGLDFVPAPGMKVQLGAIASPGDDLTWPQILDPQGAFRVMPRVVTLKAEVGYHIAAGAAGYLEGDIRVLESSSVEHIAAALVWEWKQYGAHKRIICLVEGHTARRVHEVLPDWALWSSEWEKLTLRAAIPGKLPEFSLLKPEDPWTPAFEVGLGVRADASRFRGLIEFATISELFSTALPRVARMYAEIFELREAQEIGSLVFAIPVRPPFSRIAWGTFEKAYRTYLKTDPHDKEPRIDFQKAYRQVESMKHNLPSMKPESTTTLTEESK